MFTTPITVNGQKLTDICRPGELVSYESSQDADNITFDFKNGALEIGSVSLRNLQEIIEKRDYLEKNKESLDVLEGESKVPKSLALVKSAADSDIRNEYLQGTEEIIVKAENCLEIENSLFDAKGTYIIAQQVNFNNCFFVQHMETLQLMGNTDDALFQALRFTFKKNIAQPYLAHGYINLGNHQDTPSSFIVIGAQCLDILFHDAACKN